MCYPLLFPRGDIGWYDAMHHVGRQQGPELNATILLLSVGYKGSGRKLFQSTVSCGCICENRRL